MNKQRTLLILCSTLMFLLIFSFGCSKEVLEPIKIGVMADIHGNVDSLNRVLDRFGNVDLIIVAGDIGHEMKTTEKEYETILRVLVSKEVPVFVVLGNHDSVLEFNSAERIIEEEYGDTIIDEFEYGELKIIGDTYCGDDYNRLYDKIKFIKGYDDVMIVTHCPMLYHGEEGLDILEDGRHVGSENLRMLRDEIGWKYHISGHIHESSGVVRVLDNDISSGNQKIVELDVNPGAVNDYLGRVDSSGAILVYDNGEIDVRIV